MKILTGTGDEADDLLARLYLAAVIGPFRRPNGQARQQALGAIGVPVQLVQNNTANRAMFVSVSNTGALQIINFTLGGEGGPAFPNAEGFVLKPGESLFAAPTAANAVLNVFSEVF